MGRPTKPKNKKSGKKKSKRSNPLRPEEVAASNLSAEDSAEESVLSDEESGASFASVGASSLSAAVVVDALSSTTQDISSHSEADESSASSAIVVASNLPTVARGSGMYIPPALRENASSESVSGHRQTSEWWGFGRSQNSMRYNKAPIDGDLKSFYNYCRFGNIEEIKRVIQSNKVYLRSYLDYVDTVEAGGKSNTPIHIAAFNGHVDVVTALIKAGAKMEAQEVTGKTPLHLAAKQNQIEVVLVLIKAQANMEAQEITGKTPLHLAAKQNQIEVARVLIKAQANSEAKETHGSTPLNVAALEGHAHLVQLLLDLGADKATKDNSGNTPLHLALQNHHEKIVDILLERGGFNPDAVADGHKSYTPLHYAAYFGPVRHVERLLAMGASPAKQNIYGESALHSAIVGNQEEAVNVILNWFNVGQSWNREGLFSLKDNSDNTALHSAISLGLVKIARLLMGSMITKGFKPYIPGDSYTDMTFSANCKRTTGMVDWRNIPKFAIITSPNGSGKSIILREFLEKAMADSKHTLYIPSEYSNNAVGLEQIQILEECDIKKIQRKIEAQEEDVKGFMLDVYKIALLKKIKTEEGIQQIANSYLGYNFEDTEEYLTIIHDRYFNNLKNAVKRLGQDFVEATEERERKAYESVKNFFDEHYNLEDEFNDLWISKEQEVRECCRNLTAGKYSLPDDPARHLNEIFNRHKLRLQAKVDVSEFKFYKNGDDSNPISYQNLSYGEKKLLSLMTWVYHVTHGTGQDLELLILDEPDAHFDPKMLLLFMKVLDDEFVNRVKIDELGNRNKKPIQVIMTSHRIDTIALAQENSLFTIVRNDNGSASIENTHKVLALSRLSRNLGQFTDFHITVYTEAFDDKNFYQALYNSLMEYVDYLREQDLQWLSSKQCLAMFYEFSRRYKMSFHGVADLENLGGGHSMVNKCVVHTRADVEKSCGKSGGLFGKYKISGPFGIIDADTSGIDITTAKNVDALHVKVLKRHSLENFVCDPVLICSVLREEDLTVEEFLALRKELFKEDPDKESLNTLISALFGLLQSRFSDYREILPALLVYRILRQYIKDNESIDFVWDLSCDLSVESLPRRDTITTRMEKTFKVTPDNSLSRHYKKAEEAIDASVKLSNIIEEVAKLPVDDRFVKIKILLKDRIYSLDYPKWFLYGRGHDIYDFFSFLLFDELSPKLEQLLVEGLSSEISVGKIVVFPGDLIETFAEVNTGIRNQIRDVIKPRQPKKGLLDKLRATNTTTAPLMAQDTQTDDTELTQAIALSLATNSSSDRVVQYVISQQFDNILLNYPNILKQLDGDLFNRIIKLDSENTAKLLEAYQDGGLEKLRSTIIALEATKELAEQKAGREAAEYLQLLANTEESNESVEIVGGAYESAFDTLSNWFQNLCNALGYEDGAEESYSLQQTFLGMLYEMVADSTQLPIGYPRRGGPGFDPDDFDIGSGEYSAGAPLIGFVGTNSTNTTVHTGFELYRVE